MDPASLALSVATVLETASKVVELLHDIKEGGKQRIRLTAEISSLWLVLENVKTQLDELSTSASQVSTSYLRALSLPDGPLTQCSELLNTLYEKCTPKAGPGRVLQSLKWSFDKDEVNRYLLIVHRLQTSINLSFAQTSLAVLSNVAADTSATRHVLEGQQLQQLQNWCSPLDFESQQRQTLSDWCPGTVEWVLDLVDYKAFKNGENPYLWCPAPAGCGKTVLSSVVINDLRTTFPAHGPVAVLGIYLTARSTNKDESISSEICGSLLRQLCFLGHGPDDELRAAFRSARESNIALSAEDAIIHLKRLMAPLKQTYMVVDAIDELKPHKRRIELTQSLKDLSASISIFMTGRPYDELAKLCAPLHHICDVCDAERQTGLYHCEYHLDGGWDACTNCFAKGHTHCPTPAHADPTYLPCQLMVGFQPLREDIELYVQQRIKDDDQLDGLLRGKESLKKQLVEKIVRESDERFLTAKLYLNHLATFERAREIKDALDNPLRSLEGFYTQALESLKQQRPDRVRMAQEMIKWVMFANSPLRGPELEQAVQISIEGDDFDEDDIVPIHRLLEFACGFLIQTLSGYVRFVHFTADEFLAGIVLEWFPEGLTKTTNDCLQFLSRKDFERSWSSGDFSSLLSLTARYPFHQHCAQNWSYYLDRAGDETSSVLALKFLKNDALVETAGLSSTMEGPEFSALLASKGLSGLHMAVHSRVEMLSVQLIDSDVWTNLDLQDYMGRTPLWLAAHFGQTKVVCALLDAGASADIANHAGWTPLLVAITNHRDEVVEALISHPLRPADVNINGSGNSFPDGDLSPVMMAVLARNRLAMRLLLGRSDLRIDVEVSGATVLSCSAHEGDVDGAKLLLETGKCDVNRTVEGERLLSPLHIAASEGHADMCKLLIANGADMNVLDREGKSPLMQAINHDHDKVVRSLLHSGASLSVRDKKYRTVLHHAARIVDSEVLKLLLTREELLALIDAVDSVGNTALHVALRYGYPYNGRILVMFGANVDVGNEDGQTSRELAKQKGIELFPELDSEAQGHEAVWMSDVLVSRPRTTGHECSVLQLEKGVQERERITSDC